MGFDATIKNQKTPVTSLPGVLARDTFLIPQKHIWYVQSDGWSSYSPLFEGAQIEEKIRRLVDESENIFDILPELQENQMFRMYPLLACRFGNSPLYTFEGAEEYSWNIRMKPELFSGEKILVAKNQFMHPMYKGN
jgi:hypothetical protein